MLSVRKLLFVLILLAFFGTALFLLSGCQTDQATPPSPSMAASPQAVVYTSIYPLFDFTQKIGGDKVTVLNITPADSDPHSFEPSSKLIADLSKASLFLYHGAGMEPYLEKLQATLQRSPLLMIEASRGISLIKHEHPKDEQAHETHRSGETGSNKTDSHEKATHQAVPQQHGDSSTHKTHRHAQTDPHTWLSPLCAQELCHNILQALIQIAPEHEASFAANYQKLEQQLQELHRDYQKVLAACPRKEIVVTHEAFGYLCREYGLTQVPMMGLSAEAEPTPGTLKEIINFVRKHKIKYIFFESLYSPKVAETITRETNTKLLPLNPLGSLTEEAVANGEDYFSVMRQNLQNLKLALEEK